MNKCNICDGDLMATGTMQCGLVHQEFQDCWKALQAFYRFKSLLLPSFLEKNKRALNLIESKLMEGGGKK
jgi:hypothetical protein